MNPQCFEKQQEFKKDMKRQYSNTKEQPTWVQIHKSYQQYLHAFKYSRR